MRQPRADPKPASQYQQILICSPASSGSRRQIVLGIAQYARKLPQWHLIYEPEMADIQSMATRLRTADALITIPPRGAEHQLLAEAGIATVVVGEDLPPYHCVRPDEDAIGRRAAEYFKSLGLRDVAFVGFPDVDFSTARLGGFRTAAAEWGLSVHEYTRTVYASMELDPHEFEPFSQWLNMLPKPTGILAVTASIGRFLTELCREVGVRVPEDVLVLGVDDDPFVCELSQPALSTIDQSAQQIGYRAAQLVDQLLMGMHKDDRQCINIAPRDVIVRQSTAMISADIPEVALAVRFIRESITRTIRVNDVVEHVALSRRALERAFKRNLHRSIHNEIVRQRVELGRSLLMQSDMSMQEISDRCGFSYLSKFSKTFRDQTGTTPSEFRKASRT